MRVELRPIGVVRSPCKERKDLPPLGVPASVEVFEEFSAGLLKIEKHSHLWVIVWLNEANRDPLQVTPRGVEDEGPEGLHGVFAVRSPSRPNPLGLTAARIEAVKGRVIELDRLDFMEGTPVVDLKPYFATRDMIFSARSCQVGKAAGVEAVRQSMMLQALQFSGEWSSDLDAAVRMLTHFRTEVLGYVDPPAWRVTAPLSRPKLIDALMGMTRVSLGRGSLVLHTAGSVILEAGGRTAEYPLNY
jgi:tRNA-Thr(GGU) m(6)t(6)A37 methyltransferase TsaA